ncbi:transglutaminase-like domain-containing protein [Nguyenibacter sp. L1]|uniref:transglutaminase-like domain-containing protein n=1 Tax=Nguyenibacter sp. L1 TaxID=3049350 RepID=UPI002B45ABEB|nr:transglutaminase-like domain-containing protein [Nguyenibacter sp. L1]WRH88715.1 transglutaminase-like domain-containing protein [Nguyenibacter sp. L1]
MQTRLRFEDRYRTVDEDRVLDALVLLGAAFVDDQDAARATARQALDRWAASGLGVRRDDAGRRLFDPVEVVHHLKSAGWHGHDPFWDDHYVATSRRLVGALAEEPGPDITVTLRRTFNLRHTPPTGRTRRLRLSLPLQDRCEILALDPLVPDGATHSLRDGRLEVQVPPSDAAEIDIGARIRFRPRAADAALPDPELYLRPGEGLIRLTDPVAALARHLAGDAPPPVAVKAFWDYMIDQFLSGPVHYDQIPADAPLDWVLDVRCCDCQLGAALLVGLCRARGIPARLVSGYFLYRRSPTLHYWAEIWLDGQGWASFDFMSWDLSKGGQDSAWRDHFFARIDTRMITQCLPLAFTGAIGITIPPVWRILQTTQDDGVEIDMIDQDGLSVYKDHVAVA